MSQNTGKKSAMKTIPQPVSSSLHHIAWKYGLNLLLNGRYLHSDARIQCNRDVISSSSTSHYSGGAVQTVRAQNSNLEVASSMPSACC